MSDRPAAPHTSLSRWLARQVGPQRASARRQHRSHRRRAALMRLPAVGGDPGAPASTWARIVTTVWFQQVTVGPAA